MCWLRFRPVVWDIFCHHKRLKRLKMFHLTLSSNSSQKFFRNNTTTHFTTKLPQSVTMNKEYEIGVNKIQIPVSWYNVTQNECSFKKGVCKHFKQEAMYRFFGPSWAKEKNLFCKTELIMTVSRLLI